MRSTEDKIMRACEAIFEANGSAKGVDSSLLEDLRHLCETELMQRDFSEKLTKSMHDYSVWLEAELEAEMEAELDRLPF